MALTKDDLRQIQAMMIETLTPMFEELNVRIDRLEMRMDKLEQRMDKLEQRMDKLEQRMDQLDERVDALERDFRDFKAYTRFRFDVIEIKVDHLEQLYTQRFGHVEEDVTTLYHLVDKLERGTREEKIFAEKAIVKHLPTIYKSITLIAKKHNIDLSKA